MRRGYSNVSEVIDADTQYSILRENKVNVRYSPKLTWAVRMKINTNFKSKQQMLSLALIGPCLSCFLLPPPLCKTPSGSCLHPYLLDTASPMHYSLPSSGVNFHLWGTPLHKVKGEAKVNKSNTPTIRFHKMTGNLELDQVNFLKTSSAYIISLNFQYFLHY